MTDNATILVADDNPTILTAARYCLEGAFARILTVQRPEEILPLLQQEAVDLILLDMNFSLGVNTGREGLMWLQAIQKRHPDMPVVLLTAYADVELAVRGLKEGAADFVTKPWDNSELRHKLRDALARKAEVERLDEMEAAHIRRAIDRCHGNMSEAAKLLGVSRQTLYNKMRR
ncbi:MAG: response regulator [Bacteroidaceae bacterium]|nr:response regulator [Bacteroidaceae bacterium]